MLGMCAELINWFTGLLPCIFTPVCPEPQAAVRSGRLPALERSDLNVIQLTWHAQLKIPILRLKMGQGERAQASS